jgi:glycerol-1-phosphatase
MLVTSDAPLIEVYDLAMFDLDGVIYIGGHSIAGVPEVLRDIRTDGLAVAFVTNNASRTSDTVAAKLTAMGVPADDSDVVTSAQAAARLLRDRYGSGAPVAMLGAVGLESALKAAELVPVEVSDEQAVALSTGYGPDVIWRDIMRAAVRVRAGLPWVATNADLSIPTDFGTAPGHGVLVGMLERFAGVTPIVAGKPQRPLLDETIRRVGGRRPLMVGDRLDTDIEGAHNAGVDSLLVLTGVSGLADLVTAPVARRPSYISPGLQGLREVHRAPSPVDDGGDTERFELGGWFGAVRDGELVMDGTGSQSDWWRVAATTAWSHLDGLGSAVSIAHTQPPLADLAAGDR